MEQTSAKLVNDAIRAMIYEVSVNPKPGLVDPMSSGPHPDMDVFLFIDSALSLHHYFEQSVDLGMNFTATDLTLMFKKLRTFGIEAEKTMFKATNGVNTHKGAVFSLGVLTCAEAYRIKHPQLDLTTIVKRMLKGLTASDYDIEKLHAKPVEQLTAGEKEFLRYGIKGIRGEAEAGYPTVMQIGVPALKKSQGTTMQRLLDTFMHIVAQTEDTNLIKRAGRHDVVEEAHQQAKRYLELGGTQTQAGRDYLARLNQEYLLNNYSLGGSADLLILTIFIGLRQGILRPEAMQSEGMI